MKLDRVVIGSLQPPERIKAQKALAAVYANSVPKEKIVTMNLWSFELSKLVWSYDIEAHVLQTKDLEITP